MVAVAGVGGGGACQQGMSRDVKGCQGMSRDVKSDSREVTTTSEATDHQPPTIMNRMLIIEFSMVVRTIYVIANLNLNTNGKSECNL